jgi:DedD protein
VEQAIELPSADQPGRTYTIPLDPGAGPPVQMETGNGAPPVPSRPGAGAVQRPAVEEEAVTPVIRPEPAPTPPAQQPAQPPPRPAPAPAEQPAQREAPQAASGTEGPWTVQVGSFSQADNAQALQRRLATEGFEAFVSRVATDAGTMHRVRVGPVAERGAADQLLARLRTAGHDGARVVRAQD